MSAFLPWEPVDAMFPRGLAEVYFCPSQSSKTKNFKKETSPIQRFDVSMTLLFITHATAEKKSVEQRPEPLLLFFGYVHSVMLVVWSRLYYYTAQ